MRLLTNLDYVTVHPRGAAAAVRTMSHALLLVEPREDDPLGGMGSLNHLRGFAMGGANPTFDYVLGCGIDEFEIGAHDDGLRMLRANGGLIPITSASTLRFADGTAVVLSRSDGERDLCVEEFTHEDYGLGLWDHLDRRIAEFWTAPFMPVLVHNSADAVRAVRGPA